MSATMSTPALLPVALRDTAIMVADLLDAHERTPDWAKDQHEECERQIAAFKEELRLRGFSPDQIEDATYAQCALLDETALRSLKGYARDEWEQSPLQLKEFHANDAGEELVRRMQLRLREARPVQPLFAIFAAVLDLGFTGRLALEGDEARVRLRRALDERLGMPRDAQAQHADDDVIVRAPLRRRWTQRISPLGCIGLACVAMGLAWFAIDSWLDASVLRMTH
jgi:type VI secretion system protein ImpK